MVADGTTFPQQTSAAPMPDQRSGSGRVSPSDRIVRQVEAVDAWIVARRDREHVLQAPGMNRDERMEAVREIEALRRTHDAIKGRCARGMGADVGPLHVPAVTAVIAHRHAWFVEKLALLLSGHGVTVLVCTDNGAEALGCIIAEQPDIAVVGDRLSMMPAGAVLAVAKAYARGTVLAAQASGPEQADAFSADADSVFLRHHSPAFIADALVARATDEEREASGG